MGAIGQAPLPSALVGLRLRLRRLRALAISRLARASANLRAQGGVFRLELRDPGLEGIHAARRLGEREGIPGRADLQRQVLLPPLAKPPAHSLDGTHPAPPS